MKRECDICKKIFDENDLIKLSYVGADTKRQYTGSVGIPVNGILVNEPTYKEQAVYFDKELIVCQDCYELGKQRIKDEEKKRIKAEVDKAEEESAKRAKMWITLAVIWFLTMVACILAFALC